MKKVSSTLKKFVTREEGATMVEYGLMVALIAVVCIAAVTSLGVTLNSAFNSTATSVGAAGGGS